MERKDFDESNWTPPRHIGKIDVEIEEKQRDGALDLMLASDNQVI